MPSAERREHILRTAERLFRHYGASKTTIGDIAREAGIGVGSVYLEFCSKAAIIAELAHQRNRQVLVAMRQAAQRNGGPESVAAALEARTLVLFELAEQGAHACDFMACPAKAPVSFHDGERECLSELLTDGHRSRTLDFDDLTGVLSALDAAFVALSPPRLFTLQRDEALKLTRQLNQLLLRGLLSR